MPACLICKKRDASVRFPRNSDLRSDWLTALNISEPLTKYDRLCHDHFRQSDIGCDKNGHKVLRNGCVPIAVSNNSVLSDHNYWMTSKAWEAGSTSLWLMLGLVLVCWVPFLLLLCYLTSDLARDSREAPTCSSNRVVPVDQHGKIQSYKQK